MIAKVIIKALSSVQWESYVEVGNKVKVYLININIS